MFIQFSIMVQILPYLRELGGLQSDSYTRILFRSMTTSSCGMKTLELTIFMLEGIDICITFVLVVPSVSTPSVVAKLIPFSSATNIK